MHSGSLLVDKDVDYVMNDLTIAISDAICSYLPVDLTITVSLMLLSTIWVLVNAGKKVSRQKCLRFIRS